LTEEEIIKGCKRNNTRCQHELFNMYAGRIMSVCLRYAVTTPDAEDMLQNAFVKIFNSIDQYRYDGSFEGWMRRITVHGCLALLRKKTIKYIESSTAETIVDADVLQGLSRISEKELIKVISKLPEGYRLVFNLYVIEGYTHDEIAGLLNIEAVTSRSQLAKARKMLQKQVLSQQKIIASHDKR
jgi:RNA polymerase sigma factor (sigma-70 family)